jgi:hypothetical protein
LKKVGKARFMEKAKRGAAGWRNSGKKLKKIQKNFHAAIEKAGKV